MTETMDSRPDMPSERTEKLLRQWGAAEAAEGQDGSATPVVAPVAAGRPFRRRLAIAAGLLLALGAGLTAGRYWGRTDGKRETWKEVAIVQARMANMQSDVDQAEKDLATARRLHADAEKALFDEKARLGGELSRLQARTATLEAVLADAPPAEREKLHQQIADLKTALATEKLKAETTAKRLKDTEANLATAKTALAASTKELASVKEKLSSAAEELNRVGRAQQRAVLAAKQLNDDLLQARVNQRAMLMTFQSLYLSAAAPGQTGWAARKSAAKSGKLSAQVARLRAQAKTKEGIKLLARLEVILTRLELLDTDNALEVQSFAALVSSSGLAREIDQVLTTGKEPPSVRAWLLQARLIILGGANVG